MDWLPQTVEAFGRFYHDAGLMGSLCIFIGVAMMTATFIVLWRHSAVVVDAIVRHASAKEDEAQTAKQFPELMSKVIDLHKEMIGIAQESKTVAQDTKRSVGTIEVTNAALVSETRLLVDSSAKIVERVDKLLGDRAGCNAMTRGEMEAMIVAVLQAGGIELDETARSLLVDKRMKEQEEGTTHDSNV